MKVLVLGATGMAGHMISLYLHEAGHDVTAFSRSDFPYVNHIKGNATNLPLLMEVVEKNSYNFIINAIGILNKDADTNKDEAVLLNSYLPHFLSKATKERNTRIIHMSTDCVFSGKRGNYLEHDFPDGATFYDRSKALGELDNTKDLTFRNSIIGPDMHKSGIGLFNWFMQQDGPIGGYTGAIWTGVTTITLAKAMERAMGCNLVGIYNLVNNETITKYDLLKLFNKHFREETVKIEPNDSFIADKSLRNTRMDFDFHIPSYETMILEMKEWIEGHKELYKHYF